MTKQRSLTPLYWGIGLFAVGLFFTLFTFGPLATYQEQIVWAVIALLGLGGLAALAYAVLRTERWWYFIPAFLLLSMAAIVYLGVKQEVQGILLAILLFIGLGLAHLVIFLTDRETRWWAWISAGSFFVLSAVVFFGPRMSPALVGSLLFLGMSLVFYLLYLITPASLRRWWMLALATALIIGAAFTFTMAGAAQASVFRFWPLALILFGVALMAWALVRLFAPTAPPTPTYVPKPPTPDTGGEGRPGVIPVPEELPERVAPSPPPEPEAEDQGEVNVD